MPTGPITCKWCGETFPDSWSNREHVQDNRCRDKMLERIKELERYLKAVRALVPQLLHDCK